MIGYHGDVARPATADRAVELEGMWRGQGSAMQCGLRVAAAVGDRGHAWERDTDELQHLAICCYQDRRTLSCLSDCQTQEACFKENPSLACLEPHLPRP